MFQSETFLLRGEIEKADPEAMALWLQEEVTCRGAAVGFGITCRCYRALVGVT